MLSNKYQKMTLAILALEDGAIFKGKAFGSEGERFGEVVFNTSMCGYQEILTDPSYRGQIVVMTYPLIGNYGINEEDIESAGCFVEGFACRELSKVASSWRSQKTLDAYLKENNILGIEGFDTRKLTLHIRKAGSLKAVLSTQSQDEQSLVKKAKESGGLTGIDLIKDVSCKKKYTWPSRVKPKYKVVIIDCGVKYNILRELAKNKCEPVVVPCDTSAEQILKLKPDGVLLSNGPGDPEPLTYVVTTVKKLIAKLPIFGICLGHQILGLAFGLRTYKLKFGNHGGNHPVKDLMTGKVYITSQNHSFCVDMKKKPETRAQKPEYSLSGNNEVEVTHINLNDGTCEGMRHKKLPVFSVQFHPEASPGPAEAEYLFGEFIKLMKLKIKSEK